MNCHYCQKPLPPRTEYFCLFPCWNELPAKERAMVVRMSQTNQDTTSKIAKCVRILTEKGVPK